MPDVEEKKEDVLLQELDLLDTRDPLGERASHNSWGGVAFGFALLQFTFLARILFYYDSTKTRTMPGVTQVYCAPPNKKKRKAPSKAAAASGSADDGADTGNVENVIFITIPMFHPVWASRARDWTRMTLSGSSVELRAAGPGLWAQWMASNAIITLPVVLRRPCDGGGSGCPTPTAAATSMKWKLASNSSGSGSGKCLTRGATRLRTDGDAEQEVEVRLDGDVLYTIGCTWFLCHYAYKNGEKFAFAPDEMWQGAPRPCVCVIALEREERKCVYYYDPQAVLDRALSSCDRVTAATDADSVIWFTTCARLMAGDARTIRSMFPQAAETSEAVLGAQHLSILRALQDMVVQRSRDDFAFGDGCLPWSNEVYRPLVPSMGATVEGVSTSHPLHRLRIFGYESGIVAIRTTGSNVSLVHAVANWVRRLQTERLPGIGDEVCMVRYTPINSGRTVVYKAWLHGYALPSQEQQGAEGETARRSVSVPLFEIAMPMQSTQERGSRRTSGYLNARIKLITLRQLQDKFDAPRGKWQSKRLMNQDQEMKIRSAMSNRTNPTTKFIEQVKAADPSVILRIDNAESTECSQLLLEAYVANYYTMQSYLFHNMDDNGLRRMESASDYANEDGKQMDDAAAATTTTTPIVDVEDAKLFGPKWTRLQGSGSVSYDPWRAVEPTTGTQPPPFDNILAKAVAAPLSQTSAIHVLRCLIECHPLFVGDGRSFIIYDGKCARLRVCCAFFVCQAVSDGSHSLSFHLPNEAPPPPQPQVADGDAHYYVLYVALTDAAKALVRRHRRRHQQPQPQANICDCEECPRTMQDDRTRLACPALSASSFHTAFHDMHLSAVL